MKRFLIIMSLALTLCNVATAVAYACECYQGQVLVCTGNKECWRDADNKCHCTDYPPAPQLD